MRNEFLLAIRQLAAEKNLGEDVVLDAVEAALTSAYRRDGENAPNIYVRISRDEGDIHVYRQMTVVDEVEEAAVEIAIEDARRYKADAAPGDVLDFEEKVPENAGRIAAQTAKQVVLQRLREAERDAVFDEYSGREGEIMVGTVQRVEPRQAILELGRGTEAVLPSNEQVRGEHLRSGQRLKVIVLEVQRAAKGPQVIVSRAHRSLLRRLLEMEIPEVAAGTVEIKSIAREGGQRSKVAVYSRVPSIDAIGACVGMRGIRIQNIVNELGGERIDVIKWDPSPGNFVGNALSPSEVIDTQVFPDEKRASVTVPDKMLSLAIGKEGQNARLAAKLTGWRIDIRSQSAAEPGESGVAEAPTSFVPFAEGEEPDLDLIAEEMEMPAPEPLAEPAPRRVQPAATTSAATSPATDEEEIAFAAAVDRMPIPDREEREAEDYGDEEEEYEVPTVVVEEARPSAIRFAEDVLPREDEESKKPTAKKARRGPRFAEEEEDPMEDIDYAGRIH